VLHARTYNQQKSANQYFFGFLQHIIFGTLVEARMGRGPSTGRQKVRRKTGLFPVVEHETLAQRQRLRRGVCVLAAAMSAAFFMA
jgi:hypothetical protein